MKLMRPAAARAFTLVEMLIVILIIMILTAILVVSLGSILSGGKMTATERCIDIVYDGLQRFSEAYPNRPSGPGYSGQGYPRREEFDSDATITNMTDGEWLRLILYPTQEEIDTLLQPWGIDHAVLSWDEVKDFLNKNEVVVGGRTIAKHHAFVDGWGTPILYAFPGRNHSQETTESGIQGTNRFAAGEPDIWSAGPNLENFYTEMPAPSMRGAPVPRWETFPNDPLTEAEGTGSEVNDDVCNWFNYR